MDQFGKRRRRQSMASDPRGRDRAGDRGRGRIDDARAAGHGLEALDAGRKPVIFARDEHPRVTSLEALALRKPVVRRGGSITAGNASGVNDGAAAMALASEAAARRHGLTPRARVLGMATAGVEPKVMGIGPVPATQKLMQRLGLAIADFDLTEINEAFASQVIASMRELGVDPASPDLNPHGGAIALGDPIASRGLETKACNGHCWSSTEAAMRVEESRDSRPRVVVVGGGFGGLEAAKALAKAPVDVTLIDRANHHTFQPLLYQVATAELSPADVAWPIRSILSQQKNVQVLMTEVTGVDLDRRCILTTAGSYPYDFLVLATGATHAYFGNDAWEEHAPGLKRIEDATDIRRRILTAFERAELARDEKTRRDLMTFIIVGGGPTGVEMAGAIADVARQSLPPDFRNIDPATARVMLVEAGPRLLPAFNEQLSAYAARALTAMGVEVRLNAPVTAIGRDEVDVGEERIGAGAIIWAAGVRPSAAGRWLGAATDRAGRVAVGADLTAPGRPEVFVVGDTAAVTNAEGKPVPGVAPAAKQMGHYVGARIAAQVAGRPTKADFVYKHQGDLATLGRSHAIVKLDHLTLTGFPAWAFWSVIHIYFLIGLRYRLAVALSWLWDYLTYTRRARLITEPACMEPTPRLTVET